MTSMIIIYTPKVSNINLNKKSYTCMGNYVIEAVLKDDVDIKNMNFS